MYKDHMILIHIISQNTNHNYCHNPIKIINDLKRFKKRDMNVYVNAY